MTQGAPTRSALIGRDRTWGRYLWAEGTAVEAKVDEGVPVALAEPVGVAEPVAGAGPAMAATETEIKVAAPARTKLEMAEADLECGRKDRVRAETRLPARRSVKVDTLNAKRT